jgi:hypothetical protein
MADRSAIWHVRFPDGREVGPGTKAQLVQAVQQGSITAQCQIWRPDWPQPRWAGEVFPSLAPQPGPTFSQPGSFAPGGGFPPRGGIPGSDGFPPGGGFSGSRGFPAGGGLSAVGGPLPGGGLAPGGGLFPPGFQPTGGYSSLPALPSQPAKPKRKKKAAEDEEEEEVMEAFASTSDGSPMMSMFEELMAKAIDKREAKIPEIVKSLSPLQALLISRLRNGEQFTDDVRESKRNLIVQRVGANFDFNDFGGPDHHLTLVQDLENKKLVTILANQQVPAGQYSHVQIPEGLKLQRMLIRLSMFGKWFAEAVTPRPSAVASVV